MYKSLFKCEKKCPPPEMVYFSHPSTKIMSHITFWYIAGYNFFDFLRDRMEIMEKFLRNN